MILKKAYLYQIVSIISLKYVLVNTFALSLDNSSRWQRGISRCWLKENDYYTGVP